MDCLICQNQYNIRAHSPKILNCGHTFCLQCLKRWIKSCEIECPNCRKKTYFPQGCDQEAAISFLPTNFAILENLPDGQNEEIEGERVALERDNNARNMMDIRRRQAVHQEMLPENNRNYGLHYDPGPARFNGPVPDRYNDPGPDRNYGQGPARNRYYNPDPILATENTIANRCRKFIFKCILKCLLYLPTIVLRVCSIIEFGMIGFYINMVHNPKSSFDGINFFFFTSYLTYWPLLFLKYEVFYCCSCCVKLFDYFFVMLYCTQFGASIYGVKLFMNADRSDRGSDSAFLANVSVTTCFIVFLGTVINIVIERIGRCCDVDLYD